MRILCLSNLLPPFYVGGYELLCDRICRELMTRGHEVRILTSNHGVGENPMLENEPQVERSLRVHGFFGHPWLNILGLRRLEFHNNAVLRRAIASFKPDLVYIWNLGGISKSLLHTLERLSVPTALFVSDHWIARSLVADVWLDWWNRRTSSPFSRVFRIAASALGLRKKWDALAPTASIREIKFRRPYFCSRALMRITQDKGYDVGHAAVIHCPVDTLRFQGQPAPADRPLKRLLYVGRLAEDKGIMTALRAMALIKDRFHGELCVYGKGDAEYMTQLTRFVEEHDLPVTFQSATPEEIPGVYHDHDALLFTSEWEEPFALTPLEAMASGLPVIGTLTGGSSELFRNSENALTYSAGDAQDLGERILELAASGELRHRLATTGHAEVRRRFAQPVIMDQIEAFLKETVALWPETDADQTAKPHRVLPSLSASEALPS